MNGWGRTGATLALPLLLGATLPLDVAVEVDGLRSGKGMVRACLTADAGHFPNCQHDPAALLLSVPARTAQTIVFRNVAPGRYAIALFHDENGNGRLDKTLMVPREGYGFSRDAPVRFAPPRFAAAAFTLGPASIHTAIRVRYLL